MSCRLRAWSAIAYSPPLTLVNMLDWVFLRPLKPFSLTSHSPTVQDGSLWNHVWVSICCFKPAWPIICNKSSVTFLKKSIALWKRLGSVKNLVCHVEGLWACAPWFNTGCSIRYGNRALENWNGPGLVNWPCFKPSPRKKGGWFSPNPASYTFHLLSLSLIRSPVCSNTFQLSKCSPCVCVCVCLWVSVSICFQGDPI